MSRPAYCFELVIAVADHDAAVRKYQALFGLEPIELERAKLPSPGTRCTIFPMWDQGERGMVVSIVSSEDPADHVSARIAQHGEGLVYVCIDVEDIVKLRDIGHSAGVRFLSDEPAPYVVGRMLVSDPSTTHNVPFYFSQHTPDWWRLSLKGLRD